MVESRQVGLANLNASFGQSFASIFQDWCVPNCAAVSPARFPRYGYSSGLNPRGSYTSRGLGTVSLPGVAPQVRVEPPEGRVSPSPASGRAEYLDYRGGSGSEISPPEHELRGRGSARQPASGSISLTMLAVQMGHPMSHPTSLWLGNLVIRLGGFILADLEHLLEIAVSGACSGCWRSHERFGAECVPSSVAAVHCGLMLLQERLRSGQDTWKQYWQNQEEEKPARLKRSDSRWRVGRAVECGSLENCYTCKGIWGSNP